MKRHKMINLCPTTYEIAQKMDNFSGWVRKELMKIHSEINDLGLIWECCGVQRTYRKPPKWHPECFECFNPMREVKE